MTPIEFADVARDASSELGSLPSAPMNEWPMKWRFTDPKYNVLRPIHLEQIVPLVPSGAKRLWDTVARSRLHDELPFVSGFFTRIETTSVGDSHGNAEEDGRIRKWLYQRGIPFQTQVYLSWQPDWAVRTTWKMLVKYWNDFYYPISDNLSVVDGTFRWALLFWHEHEIFFGANRRSKHPVQQSHALESVVGPVSNGESSPPTR